MPTVTSYRNGLTAGVGGGNPSPSKRGAITGWSPGAVRRHTAWLKSVNAPALSAGHVGHAVTLTVRDCPPDAEAWFRAREAWIVRMKRAGAVRIHWVTEWQRRGVPHLHTAIYWPEDHPLASVGGWRAAADWIEVTEPFRAQLSAQRAERIDGALGWLQYLSKHAARGVKHYQRQGSPPGWEKTGRLWGKSGPWPIDDPERYVLDWPAYWRYRRLVRAWRCADARAEKNVDTRRRRVPLARRMLSCSQPRLSRVRGVSEWVPEDVHNAFLVLLHEEGHEVIQK
uniref:Replication-associated protein ORF2/G2P domain-containing protein n=1 Tax=uncultured prokaryote TaxID=198431 RepID=A0A0H5Q1Z4_9ZZZZ|nr:hypothetical protein [uncultured prokaryote]